jgi:hypothetical protein
MLASSLALHDERDARSDGKHLREIMVTEMEWKAVAELVEVLKPFDDVTNYISASSYPTISVVYPAMITLKRSILACKPSASMDSPH